jgi:hypothetical protein
MGQLTQRHRHRHVVMYITAPMSPHFYLVIPGMFTSLQTSTPVEKALPNQ